MPRTVTGSQAPCMEVGEMSLLFWPTWARRLN
jgi:hypothetical protein